MSLQARREFVKRRRPHWDALATELDRSRRALWRRPPSAISSVASLYRSLCSDLMRARTLGCDAEVLQYLDSLASRAHIALYAPPERRLVAALRVVFSEFPRTLRRSWAFVAVAGAVFGVPFLVGLVGALRSEQFAMNVLPVDVLEQLADGYAQGFAEGRDGGTDAMMSGFYVYNNIGIAFRCFATGALWGAGSLFYLAYNGLATGTVLGYVSRAGSAGNILTFVSGHAPFELTAIVIAGAAGLRIGYALIDTRGFTRVGALRREGPALLALISGAAVMLLIAALIEGFWSPSSLPQRTKLIFSACGSLALLLFFCFGGRRRKRPA